MHSCTTCGKNFKEKFTLNRHEREVHSKMLRIKRHDEFDGSHRPEKVKRDIFTKESDTVFSSEEEPNDEDMNEQSEGSDETEQNEDVESEDGKAQSDGDVEQNDSDRESEKNNESSDSNEETYDESDESEDGRVMTPGCAYTNYERVMKARSSRQPLAIIKNQFYSTKKCALGLVQLEFLIALFRCASEQNIKLTMKLFSDIADALYSKTTHGIDEENLSDLLKLVSKAQPGLIVLKVDGQGELVNAEVSDFKIVLNMSHLNVLEALFECALADHIALKRKLYMNILNAFMY
jgi:hypothetical protein